jgi:phosphoribosylanthranilate isomerase
MTSKTYAPKRTAIKFCGITSARDATAALEAGADVLGIIFAPSPRRIELRTARLLAQCVPRPESLVAVVGHDLSLVPRLCEEGFRIQFCAPIDAAAARRLTGGMPYLRVVHVCSQGRTPLEDAFASSEVPLFDTAGAARLGGNGRPFDWTRIAGIAARRPVVVAGGLDARNVGACIHSVRPYGVDVRSGIETRTRKSLAKMRAFVAAVREADAAIYQS